VSVLVCLHVLVCECVCVRLRVCMHVGSLLFAHVSWTK